MKVAKQIVPLSVVSLAVVALPGCSSMSSMASAVPKAVSAPVIYTIPVQQGNLIDQAAVNQLKPGMTKSQVQYLLGTPMLVDVFHQGRWDYYYSLKKEGDLVEQKRLTLVFDGERLTGIEGDLRPVPSADPVGPGKETVYDVPDYESSQTVFTKLLERFESTPGVTPPTDKPAKMPTGREPGRGSF